MHAYINELDINGFLLCITNCLWCICKHCIG